jgi:hypothetical protein
LNITPTQRAYWLRSEKARRRDFVCAFHSDLENGVLPVDLTHHCNHPLRDVSLFGQRRLQNTSVEPELKSDHESNTVMCKATNSWLDRLRSESSDERRGRRPTSLRESADSWMRTILGIPEESICMKAEMSDGLFAILRTGFSKRQNQTRE